VARAVGDNAIAFGLSSRGRLINRSAATAVAVEISFALRGRLDNAALIGCAVFLVAQLGRVRVGEESVS